MYAAETGLLVRGLLVLLAVGVVALGRAWQLAGARGAMLRRAIRLARTQARRKRAWRRIADKVTLDAATRRRDALEARKEVRRADAIRIKAERAVRTKHDELLFEREKVRMMMRAPVLDVEV